MNEKLSGTERHHEADQLVILVKIILRLDVIFAGVRRSCEMQLGDECYIGVVEWHKPQRENLRDIEVENEILLVIG